MLKWTKYLWATGGVFALSTIIQMAAAEQWADCTRSTLLLSACVCGLLHSVSKEADERASN